MKTWKIAFWDDQVILSEIDIFHITEVNGISKIVLFFPSDEDLINKYKLWLIFLALHLKLQRKGTLAHLPDWIDMHESTSLSFMLYCKL